jgi:hypothetical protein
MASATPNLVAIWSFHHAPPEYRELFPEGGETDWVAYVPLEERSVLEPLLLRWQGVYPVRLKELADRSAVYYGAPREAMRLVAQQSTSVISETPAGKDRRAAVRVPVELLSCYETHSEPAQVGVGHTIDMSHSGIAFTTESLLPTNTEVTLHVTWPVRLEGGVPVELRAFGRLVRAEARKAALQLDSMSVSIAG